MKSTLTAMFEPPQYILEEWDSMCAIANKARLGTCPLLEDEVLVEMHKYVGAQDKKIAELEKENLKALGWIAKAMMQGLSKVDCSDELLKIIATRDLEQRAKGVQMYVFQVAETVQNYPWFVDAPPTIEELYDRGFGMGLSQDAIYYSENLLEQAKQLKDDSQ